MNKNYACVVILMAIALAFAGCIATNKFPNAPSKPSGPASGYVYTSYIYSTSATDPDGNQVKYIFNWGDGTEPSITDLVKSGKKASASHQWTKAGIFNVVAVASDTTGATSRYSRPLIVSIDAKNPPHR